MGWREFLAWLKAMNEQVKGQEPDPYSWDVHDPWFEASKAAARER